MRRKDKAVRKLKKMLGRINNDPVVLYMKDPETDLPKDWIFGSRAGDGVVYVMFYSYKESFLCIEINSRFHRIIFND